MESDGNIVNIIGDNLISSLVFNSLSKGNKNNIILIECDVPEIGTKIENIKEGNEKIKKDYYGNNYKETYFYPFFNMDKGHPTNNTKYKLTYCLDDNYNLYIFKKSNEEDIKIQINNKNIIKIVFNISKNKIELYFYLKNPPKVYKKQNIITTTNYFFYEKFENYLNNYGYDNLYRNIDSDNPKRYFAVSHFKKKKENNNIIIEDKIISKDSKDYIRDVSYFSLDNEFENLYMNDLIIKISFKKNKTNKGHFNNIKRNLKCLNVKFKNNHFYYEKISSINYLWQNKIKELITKSCKIFYESLQNMIQNLQFSLMSLLTVQQINIFNFDLSIIIFLSRKDNEEQENAAEIIDKINNTKNYTHINLDYLTFIKDYSSNEGLNLTYNNNKTKSITITPSKIIYNLSSPVTTNQFQRKLINYNDNIIKVSIVDEDNNNFCFTDIKSNILLKFLKNLFKNGITLGFFHYNYIWSSNSQLKKLGGWMVNLEGIRTNIKINDKFIMKKLKNNNNYIIEKSNFSTFQLYKNCEEIIDIFGEFSKEKNIFKNTARKGMIFSDTKYVTNVDINNVVPLEDEKIGEYIITDGIGKISSDLIELAAGQWGIKELKKTPISAIQIRFMGCKGVFALDPALPKNTIHYRESQKKYKSDDTSLNICSVGNYKEGFLNRQLIILLNSLGVENKVFEKIEDDIIINYINLLKDPYNTLSNNKPLYYEFKDQLLNFIPSFEFLFSKNIDLLNEPLFSQLIHLFVYNKLITIKYNGRLNDRKCVCLMGVIDETNILIKKLMHQKQANS